MTRKFTEMLFLGNGDASKAEVARLHERLDEAISLLSGLQQAPMATERPNPAEDELRAQEEVELLDVIEDVATALLGPCGVEVHPHPVQDLTRG